MSTLRVGMAALAIAFTSGAAFAQTTTPPADTPPAATAPAPDPTTPAADATAPAMTTKPDTAMNQTGTESQKPPLSGANSFTEGQARDRITKAGFEDVQTLKKDDQGVWRGQAKKSGQQVNVGLDYRGNVVQQ
jgi:periplasmic protein CpxP/Spy